MSALVDLLALPIGTIAMIAFLLAGFFAVETIVGLLPSRGSREVPSDDHPATAVVIPAHNEEAVIGDTLRRLESHLSSEVRVLVVADNCTDQTAELARAEGADVIERSHPTDRGKGFALQFALDHLKEAPPEVVVFFDADCVFDPPAEGHDDIGPFRKLADAAFRKQIPVQALYLMEPPEDPSPKEQIAAFAWRLINKFRQTGLDRVAGVTRLTGSGMAMPWSIADVLALGSGEIVEDLALTVSLAKTEYAPRLLSSVVVKSQFPTDEAAAAKQHARWEHGSLRLALGQVPDLLQAAISRGRPQLAALAFDLAIPPITLFVGGLGFLYLLCGLLALTGAVWPFMFAGLAIVYVVLAIAIAWVVDGRDLLPASSLAGIAGFLASKTGVYGREARQSTRTWTRTERD
ncbi:MAG: glycosyltransferase family 2 protein [Pseudomonadota bacterium]